MDAHPWNSTRNSQRRPMSRYVMDAIFPVFSTVGYFYFEAGYIETGIRNFLPCSPDWLRSPFTAGCAVHRQTASGRIRDIHERISVDEALRAATLGGAHAAPEQLRDLPVGRPCWADFWALVLHAGTGTSPQLVLRICLILRHRRLSGGGRRPLPRPRAHRPAPAPCARTSGPWHLRSSASSAPSRPWAAAASSPSASRDSHRA